MNKKLSGLLIATCVLFSNLSGISLPTSAVKSDIAISIDQVSVSMHQLETSNYEVPVFIRLEQNENLNAIEFGLEIDPNCRFEFITRNTYAQIYNETLQLEMSCQSSPNMDGYAWITWANNQPYFQENSNILLVLVKLPETAQPNDDYYINYLTQSPLNEGKNHIWYNYGTKTNYATNGTITWTDGYIKITEDEEPLPGDATLDGKVDIIDIIAINKAILGQKILTSLENKASDVDRNGIVDTTDSLNIMKFIVGLIDEF
ncbi:MAG: dockerin type I repeat-containing protein [Oscillospiraceae bacterium]|nr:dockerin type I repeat-containing protein [Oscillospiraceae bacterium]